MIFWVFLALQNQRRPRTIYRQTLFVADVFEAKANKTDQADESNEADDAITDAAEADTADVVDKATDAANEAEFDNPTIVEVNGHDVPNTVMRPKTMIWPKAKLWPRLPMGPLCPIVVATPCAAACLICHNIFVAAANLFMKLMSLLLLVSSVQSKDQTLQALRFIAGCHGCSHSPS